MVSDISSGRGGVGGSSESEPAQGGFLFRHHVIVVIGERRFRVLVNPAPTDLPKARNEGIY